MSEFLESEINTNKTLYGAKVDILRFQPGETAIVAEINNDSNELRAKLIYKGGFWWATAEELSVIA